MPNEIRYKEQRWSTPPIARQLLSFNACYCGQPLGTPTQDALYNGNPIDLAVSTPVLTVHLGTVMQDAIPGSTPEVVE